MMNDEKSRLVRSLNAQIPALRDNVYDALTKAGFTVTKGSSRMIVASDKVSTRFFEPTIEISVQSQYLQSTKIRGIIRISGERPRIITKLKGFGKTVLNVIDIFHGHAIARAENQQKHDNDQAKWLAHRSKELGGVPLPPGVDVRVINGNHAQSGKYAFKFDRLQGLETWALTADQIKQVVALLNEIKDTQKLFVLAVHDTDRIWFWDGSMFTTHLEHAKAVRADEVEDEKKQASSNTRFHDVKVEPYAKYSTIH